MSEESNVQIVRSGYEKFGSGDIAGLLQLFDQNIEWNTPAMENSPLYGNRQGLDSVREFFSQLAENEEFSHFAPTEFIAQGDRVVVLGKADAKVLSTGRNYSTEWVHVFRVKDGKVTAFKEMFDTAAVTKAFEKAAAAEA